MCYNFRLLMIDERSQPQKTTYCMTPSYPVSKISKFEVTEHRLRKWKSLSCVRLFATPWTVHGILQAILLEEVAVPFSRASFQPRDWSQVSRIAGGFFRAEPPGKPKGVLKARRGWKVISTGLESWQKLTVVMVVHISLRVLKTFLFQLYYSWDTALY